MGNTSVTTIRIPTEDYRRWQHLAVDTNTSVNQMIQEAMREYLAKTEDRKRSGSYL